jgi:hypothetical protein
MLWPEKREKDRIFAVSDNSPGVGKIDRTTWESYIWVPSGYLPDGLRRLIPLGQRLFPMLIRNGSVEIGPIPQGTPVSLLANADLMGADLPPGRERLEHVRQLVDLLIQAKRDLKQGKNFFENQVVMDKMLSLSKCPDFVVNKGHYFGTSQQSDEPGLSDADKRALIAFVKTF